jgi:hypothetical protein
MMSYEDGSLRIAVHTGNLIESDWEDRTQGMCMCFTKTSIGQCLVMLINSINLCRHLG